MKNILCCALLALSGSLLSASPTTWYLNNVTFTDGGRAFGNFTIESTNGIITAVNVQTTPAASTTSAASAVGGGIYNVLPVVTNGTPVYFVSGGIGANVRRFQILTDGNALLSGGTNSIALSGNEGFCDFATCQTLIGPQSRSISSGQLVTTPSAAPVTFYLIATMDDGSQAVGSFDFDSGTNAYSNVDIAITAGTSATTSARLTFAQPSPSGDPTATAFMTTQSLQPGTRFFVMAPQSPIGGTTGGVMVPGSATPPTPTGSYQGACPTPIGQCAILNLQLVVFGSVTTIRPPGFVRVISQVADGEGWQTQLVITNTSDGAAPYAVTFRKDDGTPFAVGGIGSFVTATVPAGGVAFLTSSNPASLTQGSATLIGGHNFSVTTIFTSTNTPAGNQQGSVVGDAQGAVSFSVPFDNTAGAVGGFALTNTNAAAVTVLTVAYDETGKILLADSSLTLPAYGHTAFTFESKPGYSTLAGKRGLLRVFAIHPGATPPYPGLNGLLLKFLPNASFTTLAVTNN